MSTARKSVTNFIRAGARLYIFDNWLNVIPISS
jgi:hypothetical protein